MKYRNLLSAYASACWRDNVGDVAFVRRQNIIRGKAVIIYLFRRVIKGKASIARLLWREAETESKACGMVNVCATCRNRREALSSNQSTPPANAQNRKITRPAEWHRKLSVMETKYLNRH